MGDGLLSTLHFPVNPLPSFLFSSRRRLSLKMQEIDEAIHRAESASLTMAKVKTQDITTKDEDLVLVSMDKVIFSE